MGYTPILAPMLRIESVIPPEMPDFDAHQAALVTSRHGIEAFAKLTPSRTLPILTVALVTGLCIGLFQALTSIQEMTLTFVPKLAAIVAVFWITMAFMTEALVSFFQGTLIPIIVGG